MTPRKIAYITGVVMLGMLLVACERTSIGDITADPGHFMNKDVNVAGQVTQSIGFMGKGIYQIDDGTGRLWVLANGRGVPSKGATVGVKGKVTPTVTFMGVNYATVMRESNRKAAELDN
jgi:hypothetical protein